MAFRKYAIFAFSESQVKNIAWRFIRRFFPYFYDYHCKFNSKFHEKKSYVLLTNDNVQTTIWKLDLYNIVWYTQYYFVLF